MQPATVHLLVELVTPGIAVDHTIRAIMPRDRSGMPMKGTASVSAERRP
jgi:hypothetical protein